MSDRRKIINKNENFSYGMFKKNIFNKYSKEKKQIQRNYNLIFQKT